MNVLLNTENSVLLTLRKLFVGNLREKRYWKIFLIFPKKKFFSKSSSPQVVSSFDNPVRKFCTKNLTLLRSMTGINWKNYDFSQNKLINFFVWTRRRQLNQSAGTFFLKVRFLCHSPRFKKKQTINFPIKFFPKSSSGHEQGNFDNHVKRFCQKTEILPLECREWRSHRKFQKSVLLQIIPRDT